MAKKDIKGDAKKEEQAKQAAEAREAKERAAASDNFKFLADPDTKLAPQAQAIVNIVKEAGKKGIVRSELLKAMEEVVTTRQPIQRILAYYQKKIQEVGAVEMTKA